MGRITQEKRFCMKKKQERTGVKVQFYLPEEYREQFETIMKEENRIVANLGQTLTIEALKARDKQGATK